MYDPVATALGSDTVNMEKQLTATIVVFLFCLLYTIAIAAQERSQPSAVAFASTKAEVDRLGFGKRVNSGRITGYADNHFVVTDSKGTASTIAYSEVLRITQQKEKLGIFDRAWTGIMFTAAGVGTVIVMTLAWLD